MARPDPNNPVVCKDCGSDRIERYTAGGYMRVRCKVCQSNHALGPSNYVEVRKRFVDTPNGPLEIEEEVYKLLPAGNAPLEHEREVGGMRDAEKNYPYYEEEE